MPNDVAIIVHPGAGYTFSGDVVTPTLSAGNDLTVFISVRVGGLESQRFPAHIDVTAPIPEAPPRIRSQPVDLEVIQGSSIRLLDDYFEITDDDSTVPDNVEIIIHPGAGYTFSGDVVTPTVSAGNDLNVFISVIVDGLESQRFLAFIEVTAPAPKAPPRIRSQPADLAVTQGSSIRLLDDHFEITDDDSTVPSNVEIIVHPGFGYTFNGDVVTPTLSAGNDLTVFISVIVDGLESQRFPAFIEVTAPVPEAPPRIRSQPVDLEVGQGGSIRLLDDYFNITDDDSNVPDNVQIIVHPGFGYTFNGDVVTPTLSAGNDLTVFISVIVDGLESRQFPAFIEVVSSLSPSASLLAGPVGGAAEVEFTAPLNIALSPEEALIQQGLDERSITPDWPIEGTDEDDDVYGFEGNEELRGYAGNDTLEGFGGDDVLLGGEGNDDLIGGDGSDLLLGEAGNDNLFGGAGDDELVGGLGDDFFEDEGGNDTYIVNRGDGHDFILDQSGFNTLDFQSIELSSAIRFQNDRGNLVIIIEEDVQSVTIEEFFFDDWQYWKEFKFSNAVIGSVEVAALASGSGTLTGDESSNALVTSVSGSTLIGLGGDDIILGLNGSEEIIGGTGNDLLKGGVGNDTYVYNLGDGNDVIDDTSGFDAIVFGEGITKDNIRITASVEDLFIHLSDGATITFKNRLYLNGNQALGVIRFSDGSSYTGNTLGENTIVTGTDSDDVLDSSHARFFQSHDGGLGDDKIIGGQSRDTYHYSLGGGSDTIIDGVGALSYLVFGEGITPDNINLAIRDQDLIITLPDNETLTFQNGVRDDGFLELERITFADGQVITRNNIGRAARVTGTDGDDVLDYSNIRTFLSHDAGLGNDDLIGGLNKDYYYYNLGDGNDTISDGQGTLGRLYFGAGITRDNISSVIQGNDLIITLPNNETLTVKNAIRDDGALEIELVSFEGAGFLNRGQFGASIIVTGTEDDDVLDLSHTTQFHSYDAGQGDDDISGGRTQDTYYYTVGDGNDTIIDSLGSNLLRLSGVTTEDLSFYRDGTDGLIVINTNNQTIRVRDWYINGDNQASSAHIARIFTDVGSLSPQQISDRTEALPSNMAPQANLLADFATTNASSINYDAGTAFSDEEILTFSASLLLGSEETGFTRAALPTGLSFDSATGVFTGTVASVGNYLIEVSASDGELSTAQTFTLQIVQANRAPTAGAIANVSTTNQTPLNVDVSSAFSDLDNDVLSYSAVLITQGAESTLPPGLVFDTNTGVFTGTVPNVGDYVIQVTAHDGEGESVSSDFTLSVTQHNRAPVFEGQLTATVEAGASFVQSVVFSDADDDSVSLSFDGLPSWLNVDTARQELSGFAPLDAQGEVSFTVIATDNQGGVTAQEITLTVTPRPPQVLSAQLQNQSVGINNSFTYSLANEFTALGAVSDYTVEYQQADGTYAPLSSAADLAWLSFSEGVFGGIPTRDDVNNGHSLRVTASNALGDTQSGEFRLSVTGPAALELVRVEAVVEQSFQVSARDYFSGLSENARFGVMVSLASAASVADTSVLDSTTTSTESLLSPTTLSTASAELSLASDSHAHDGLSVGPLGGAAAVADTNTAPQVSEPDVIIPEELSDWLSFDRETGLLSGIPTSGCYR